MSRVDINTDMLEWAIDRSGKGMDYLEGRFNKLSEWLAGERNPTLNQLKNFARATNTPFGYLFLDHPPEERLGIPYFRTGREDYPENPSPELLDTYHQMKQRQDWMREHLENQGQEPLSFVDSVDPENSSPIQVAQKIREFLDVDPLWANEASSWEKARVMLKETMEEAGILVVINGCVGNNTHRKLNPNEFRGFVLIDEYAPLVFVNNADSKAAQMFTMAHELAHVVFGSEAAFDLRKMMPADNEIEKKCNSIAAEFLVPARNMEELWERVRGSRKPFETLARQFKVSELVVARRALELDLINEERFSSFYDSYTDRIETREGEGGNFYNNQNYRIGDRFAEAVFRAVKSNDLLYSEAYDLTGLTGKTFDRYADRKGFDV